MERSTEECYLMDNWWRSKEHNRAQCKGHEFKTEIELLSTVHHRNLVSLVGFCCEQGEQMLIFEFMPNGTLYESLAAMII